MRFVLLVEGDTEKACIREFLCRWLNPRLGKPVGIKAVQIKGWAKFRKDVASQSRWQFKHTAPIAVIGLLDYYAPQFFPNNLNSPEERIDWAVNKISNDVDRERFRMYFAVHEFEAWLFSEPDIFPQRIKADIDRYAENPEQINDQEPPSKLLIRLYRERLGRRYNKVADGQQLFRRLNPEIAAEKCPRLRTMLNEMLAMAKTAGL